MSPFSAPVLWAVLGLALLAFEIFSGAFVFVFFGVAALVVALCRWLGVVEGFTSEVLLFTAVGITGLVFFRRQVVKSLRRGGSGHDIDRHAAFDASAALPARGDGKLEYQGTVWDAHNDSDQAVARGDRVVVVSTRGIKLVVRPHGR